MDDFYTRLEQGKISPMMFWKEEVSKYTWMEQAQLMIGLIGKCAKEEREGRSGSDLHRYAKHLAEFISNKMNNQRTEREQQAIAAEVNKSQFPEILNNPDIRKDFDKAIQIGLLEDYYTLKASKWLLACFIWGICVQYNISTKAKTGKDKGGFAANWRMFSFIKDKTGKEIDLRQGWQNTKNKNYNPQKLRGFAFWKHLGKELNIN